MSKLSSSLLAVWLTAGLFQAASAQIVVPPGADMDLGGGELDLACEPVEIGGTYKLSGGSLRDISDLQVDAGGKLDAQGSLEVGGHFANAGQIDASAGTVTVNGACLPPGTPIRISGTLNVANLHITSNSGQTVEIQPGASITVTGQLSIEGQPGKPLQITSANDQPVAIQVAPTTQVSQSNVSLDPNVSVKPTVTPPVTAKATPVPSLGNAMAALLSLVLLVLSLRTLRGNASSLFRKPTR